MIHTALCVAALALPALAQESAQQAHPVHHDRTGITWTTPFGDALAQAKQANRILVIKPVAFGTTTTGCW